MFKDCVRTLYKIWEQSCRLDCCGFAAQFQFLQFATIFSEMKFNDSIARSDYRKMIGIHHEKQHENQ